MSAKAEENMQRICTSAIIDNTFNGGVYTCSGENTHIYPPIITASVIDECDAISTLFATAKRKPICPVTPTGIIQNKST